ncbi:MAG: hypothetical protein GY832_35195 [Chloroflexi bacterium]|nr:hypothetical protein [Chloroflexota bacterium]
MMNKTPNFKWLLLIIGFVALSIVHCSLLIAQAQSSPPIVINELQYHPLSDDHREEYIELYNSGTITMDISGWRFSDGVVYTFPPSTTILPSSYVVVGYDPTTVETVYSISGVLGPFVSGRLANGGERVALEDDLGSLVDEVTYDDHHPWPELPDGNGPSLELINPTFDNNRPCSWGSNQPITISLGTPGAQNSIHSSGNVPPCITDVTHTPIFPTASQPVTVTALVNDNNAVVAVTLYYRPEGTPNYITLPMTDDGSNFGAVIPASEHDDGLYVEFYIIATDDEGADRIVPDGAPGSTSNETGQPITISYLYQVENNPPANNLPIYRLVTTQENWAELTTRDLFSNVLLDATFVYSQEVFYNVGVRYRGESTRNFWPRPYRIKFNDAHEFEDRERLNLVSDELGREALTHDLFRRVGLPASDTRFVTLYINETQQGDYLDIEQVDNDFLEAHFPENDSGNLYRGYDGADLTYRGPDPNSYRPYYLKKNNEDADDYVDIIALTNALTNSPDASFHTELEPLADIRQWMRWFAVHAVLDNHEGALWIGHGDDYFLYRRPSDKRFILISWDHDATFLYPHHGIWEPNWYASEIVRRILNYPRFTRWYFQNIASIAANEFAVAEMHPRIDALPDVVDGGDKNYLKGYVTNRIPTLNNEIPSGAFSINTNGGADFSTPQTEITLEGGCSPLRDVHVNGDPSTVQYPTVTTWRYTNTLETRDNVFVISDGLYNHKITVYWDYFHGGILTKSTTLLTSQLPYTITDDIVVPTGITLTIEPGVTLNFAANRMLRVEGGRLLAEGTIAQPTLFTRQGDDYWDGILFAQSQTDNRIRYAEIEYAQGVSIYGSSVTITNSTIHHISGSVGIQASPWVSDSSTLYLLRNEITDIQGDAVRVAGSYGLIQGNEIHNVGNGTLTPASGIVLSDVVSSTTVLDNHVHDISGHGLDLAHSSATIERNLIHGCDGSGISIGYPSTTAIVNNLVYSNTDGIAIKDNAIAHITNNTVADNQSGGVRLYEEHPGEGSGIATVVNSILWGNETDLDLNALSTVTVTYSNLYTYTATGTTIWPGEGNINTNPLFRAPQNGRYRLMENSPCVDTGTPVGAPDDDMWGIYRPHGDGYDRGAHEFFEYFDCYLPLLLRSY